MAEFSQAETLTCTKSALASPIAFPKPTTTNSTLFPHPENLATTLEPDARTITHTYSNISAQANHFRAAGDFSASSGHFLNQHARSTSNAPASQQPQYHTTTEAPNLIEATSLHDSTMRQGGSYIDQEQVPIPTAPGYGTASPSVTTGRPRDDRQSQYNSGKSEDHGSTRDHQRYLADRTPRSHREEQQPRRQEQTHRPAPQREANEGTRPHTGLAR